MPREKDCSKEHCQDIWQGKKKVFKEVEVPNKTVPNWEELSLEKMMMVARTINGFYDYIPANWSLPGVKVERRFFFGIFYKLNPDLLDLLIDNAQTLRYQRAHNKKMEKPEAQPAMNE
jgi:hypothetical protein